MGRRHLLLYSVVLALLTPLVSAHPGLAGYPNDGILGCPREHEVGPRVTIPRAAIQQQPVYNTPFLTDTELEDCSSMTSEQIRLFLASYSSYYSEAIQDADDQTFDPSEIIAQAASQYRINPKVILATLQKESSGVTQQTRPSDRTMRALMGCATSVDIPEPLNTARGQLWCAAERFRAYHDRITSTGSTQSGWQVEIPKLTQDGVSVTPATKAVAGQFTYTPYAGTGWGGRRVCGPNQDESCGGVHLFYEVWNQFGFSTPTSRQFLTLPFLRDASMRVQQGWQYNFYSREPACPKLDPNDHYLHCGIDYVREETVDQSSTWVAFDVLAAADGEACGDCADGPPGSKSVWIKHNVEGEIFYTYYGHLSEIAPRIPLGSQSTTVTVERGEKIGVSGDTGARGQGIHLHFMLKNSKDIPVDPYGLNTTADEYPDPNSTTSTTTKPVHYWTTYPPTYAAITLAFVLYEQPEFPILKPDEETEIYFKLQNVGSQTWEAGHYALVNVNDLPLGAPSQMALNVDVPSGQPVSWPFLITAPSVPGVYRTEWQFSYDGQLIGPLLWMDVIVVPGGGDDLAEIIRSMIEEARQRGEEWFREQWEELRRQIIELIWAEMMRQIEEFLAELCGGSAATGILSLAVLWLGRRRSRSGDREH